MTIFFFSCNNHQENVENMINYKNTITIWTNQTAFIPYIEYFNLTHDDEKAIMVYKDNSNIDFSFFDSSEKPDIIIESYIHSDKDVKHFKSLENLFIDKKLNPKTFYPQLLNLGSCNRRQYFLPVSFNLPVVIFSRKNKEYIKNNYSLSLEDISKIAGKFNKKNKSNMYTKMGFAPQWNSDFLYLCARFKGTDFHILNNSFTWNEQSLNSTLTYLRNWTSTENTSSNDEQDFSFKYLYVPYYQQVNEGHCLFSYTTSNNLFMLSSNEMHKIDYRWIIENNKIPIEDSALMLGVYNKAPHKDAAETFILWFFKEKTQRELMKHVANLNLDTATFGIADGFSSIKSVNDKVFPAYYEALLTNVPESKYMQAPKHLPLNWESLKEKIVIPYLKDAVQAKDLSKVKNLKYRISDWKKQNN